MHPAALAATQFRAEAGRVPAARQGRVDRPALLGEFGHGREVAVAPDRAHFHGEQALAGLCRRRPRVFNLPAATQQEANRWHPRLSPRLEIPSDNRGILAIMPVFHAETRKNQGFLQRFCDLRFALEEQAGKVDAGRTASC
jgi:hypothetical protein